MAVGSTAARVSVPTVRAALGVPAVPVNFDDLVEIGFGRGLLPRRVLTGLVR